MEPVEWLSVEQLAVHLSISEETIYSWLKDGKVPAHKVGRLWRFSRGEIDSWVRAGKAAFNSKSLREDVQREGISADRAV